MFAYPRPTIVVAALALAAALAPAAADAQDWQFAITPYLWLPNIEGTGDVETDSGARPDVEIGPVDYLERLEFALMLSGEARRENWVLRADLVYVDFGHQRSSVRSVSGPGGLVEFPVNTDTTTSLDGLEWQATLGYLVVNEPNLSLELLGGFRYLDVSFDLDWEFESPLSLLPQSGHLSQDVSLLDVIVGTHGRYTFGGGKWFVPFHFDIGTGDSDLTWQLLAGVGYTFSWGDVLLAYRHLDYDQKHGDLLQGVSLSGPAIGVSFRF